MQEVAMSSLEIAYRSSYEDLWYACAGPGVTIPKVGELAVYFPQGHLEHTGGTPKHLQGVPSQILCRVLNVELKSMKDLVYAQLVLLPELSQDLEASDNMGLPPPVRRINAPYCFCKKLRAFETVDHAWLSIPRKHAEKCLPPLDMTQMAPMQELLVTDISGQKWRFQHRLVTPRRHCLQAADFVTSKNIVVGDTLVILRGENGELRVGVRRSMRHLQNASSSEISHDNNLSILPSIHHAVTTRSMFIASYRPWTGTDHFVVPYNQYIESISDCCPGRRFRMILSREATTEDRVSGTISGIEDFDTAWPGSKWKCLKVKLDTSTTISNRVSPWEVKLEKRSVHVLDFEMKQTRSQRVLQREEQRQKAAALLSDGSPFDTKACLTNAKRVLQLHHDGSMLYDSSILESKIYLSAIDDLIYLSTGSSFGISDSVDDVCTQAQAALDTAMSNLARTFYDLKLWNTNHFTGLDRPPSPASLVSNLNSALTLHGPCLSSSSSEPVSSGSDTGASSRDSDLITAEGCSVLHDIMSCLEEEKLELINPKSVNAVASIASQMIKAGYKERLRDTFTNLSQNLMSELQALNVDRIFQCCSMVDEVDSNHGDDMPLQYWNSASRFITRVLVEMRRQLHEQNFGAFDELKGDYFAKIAEQPVLKLLNVASLSASINRLLDDVPQGSVQCLASIFLRIVNALIAHKTVTGIVRTLLGLVSEECRESVSREAEAIRERVEDVVSRMLDTVTNVISSSVLQQTEGSNIHPVTKAVAKGIGSLIQHRETLNVILARKCCKSLQGTHATISFRYLISNLMMHLESVLEQRSKLLAPKELQYIFLLNNLQFALQRVQSPMTMVPMGHDWVVRYQKKIENFLNQYIETSWAPVSSYIEGQDGKRLSFWKPSCVQQFTEAVQSVYYVQRHWKVPDPNLRQNLRLSISKKIVPSYCGYLKKHKKNETSLKMTVNNLQDLLAELFEG